jgi:hypothetical protein
MDMASAVSPESVIAAKLLQAKEKGRSLEIEDISRTLLDLEEKGFDLGDTALRRVPGGVYSEDVEAFVGRMLAAGYAKARSPIEVFEDGLRVCKLIVQEEYKENRESFEAVAGVLEFDTARFTGPTRP